MMNYIQVYKSIFAVLILATVGSVVWGGQEVNIGRYSIQKAEPDQDQYDTLSVIIQLKFPQQIEKVGEALEYILQPSGYRLESPDKGSPCLYLLFNQELPRVHRALGPMTLRSALQVLGGESFELQVNPVTRTVAYQLRKGYLKQLTLEDIELAEKRWKNRERDMSADVVRKSNEEILEHESDESKV